MPTTSASSRLPKSITTLHWLSREKTGPRYRSFSTRSPRRSREPHWRVPDSGRRDLESGGGAPRHRAHPLSAGGECDRTVSDGSHLRRSCGSRALRHVAIVPRSQPVVLLRMGFGDVHFRALVVIGIFLAIDRGHMRRISVEIRPADSELLSVFIDPFPEDLRRRPALVA